MPANTEEKNSTRQKSLNEITIVGRVGQDPEIKYFDSGKAKTILSMAVNRGKDQTGTEITDWFRVELWDRSAEVAAEYVKKGNLIGIVGSLSVNRWTDNNGLEKEVFFIRADELKLLGKNT